MYITSGFMDGLDSISHLGLGSFVNIRSGMLAYNTVSNYIIVVYGYEGFEAYLVECEVVFSPHLINILHTSARLPHTEVSKKKPSKTET